MKTLGIDWAARYSAAILMDEDQTVMDMWVIDLGAAEKPPRLRAHIPAVRQFVGSMYTTMTHTGLLHQTNVIIENVSHFMMNPAPVLRLQGVLEDELDLHGFREPTLVLPTVWQAHFNFQKSTKAVKAPTTKAQAKALCQEFGYEFDIGGKAKIDLNDAALIARWGQETIGEKAWASVS